MSFALPVALHNFRSVQIPTFSCATQYDYPPIYGSRSRQDMTRWCTSNRKSVNTLKYRLCTLQLKSIYLATLSWFWRYLELR